MSKEGLTADEITLSLTNTIMNLQNQLESSRQEYIEKIKNKDKEIDEKEKKIEEITNELANMQKNKEDQAVIERFRNERDMINGELTKKINELSSALLNESNLNNQIEMLQQNIIELKSEKNKIIEENKENNEKYKNLQNQFFLLQKQLDSQTEKNSMLQNTINEKEEKIKELNQNIQELTEKIKKSEEQNNNLLKFVKEMREAEDKIAKEKEEIKQEREKYNILIKELEKKKKEEKKKSEIEKLIKKETKSEEGIKELNSLEREKILIDLLCEFLLKLNNLQYYISLFDLMDDSLKKYDELKYIYNLNKTSHESMNDLLYSFYESFKSYISISQKNANLNDFLLQKNFKLTNMTKEEVEIIKKINSIKFSQNIDILDVYREKREIFFKSKEFTFNVLKEKVLNDEIKKEEGDSGLGKNEIEFLKMTKPPLELDINFNKLLNQDYNLVRYQLYNIFSKLRELSICISNIPIFLIYSLIVNCKNFISLKIDFIKDELNSENNKDNIIKLNSICPILLKYLKKLESFSLVNLPLLPTQIPFFVESLKLSNLKKLSLINCFTKKEDLNLILPLFSNNSFSEIDFSNHNFHIPSLLNESILNSQIINEKLTSIRFNNCELDENDIKIITNFVASSQNLKILDIGKNTLSSLACSTFGYCISKTNSLETLRINECGINGENILFIFNAKGSKTLKHINLNGNEIGDIGLVSISAFMKKSPKIESIELKKCGGTNMGFSSLVNMIESNISCKIKYVNFQKNSVNLDSLKILKNNNENFKKRKLVFALDKIEQMEDNFDLDCAIFT